jgi:hypothetical protein
MSMHLALRPQIMNRLHWNLPLESQVAFSAWQFADTRMGRVLAGRQPDSVIDAGISTGMLPSIQPRGLIVSYSSLLVSASAFYRCNAWNVEAEVMRHQSNNSSRTAAHLCVKPKTNLELAAYSICSAEVSYFECLNMVISWIWVHIRHIVSLARNINPGLTLFNKRTASPSLFVSLLFSLKSIGIIVLPLRHSIHRIYGDPVKENTFSCGRARGPPTTIWREIPKMVS